MCGGGEKQSNGDIIKLIRNLFKLKKESEEIKDRIIRDIKTLYKKEEKDYYKPMMVGNFWNSNYIEYESNGDKNKNQSVKEYSNKIILYFRDIIINLPKRDTKKIQPAISINFISSEDVDEFTRACKSDNIKFMPYDNLSEFVNELSELILSRYHIVLETVRGICFIFDLVQLLYYKCHKINFEHGDHILIFQAK